MARRRPRHPERAGRRALGTRRAAAPLKASKTKLLNDALRCAEPAATVLPPGKGEATPVGGGQPEFFFLNDIEYFVDDLVEGLFFAGSVRR